MTPKEYEIFKLKATLSLLRFNDPTITRHNPVNLLEPGSDVWCDQIMPNGDAIMHAGFGGGHAEEYPFLQDLYCIVPKEYYDKYLEPTGDSVNHPDKIAEKWIEERAKK